MRVNHAPRPMILTPEQISAPDVSSLSYQEKYDLAKNPNTPVETLRVLATDEDYYVRRGVAQNPNTPVETLRVFATDDYWGVSWGVAENPSTPVEILKVLATDGDSRVRCGVASNPNTPAEALKVLATDENWRVRNRVMDRYLIQTREQIQEDLLTLIDSKDQELNDKICQIVVDNFVKFFPEAE